MTTDQEVKDLGVWFWEASTYLQSRLAEKFPDASFQFAGAVKSGGEDVHFYLRCSSSQLKEPWVCGVHVMHSGGRLESYSDVVEEESGKVWWEGEHLTGGEEFLAQHVYFMSGALWSGASMAIKSWEQEDG